MKKIIMLAGLVFAIFGCKNAPDLSEKVAQLETQLSETQKALTEIKEQQVPDSYNLMHMVFLDLKDDLSREAQNAIMADIEALKNIPGVKGLHTGRFEDLGDPRAWRQYDMVLYMRFQNADDYRAYQNNPIHLNLKKNLAQYLAAPPATYDFRIE